MSDGWGYHYLNTRPPPPSRARSSSRRLDDELPFSSRPLPYLASLKLTASNPNTTTPAQAHHPQHASSPPPLPAGSRPGPGSGSGNASGRPGTARPGTAGTTAPHHQSSKPPKQKSAAQAFTSGGPRRRHLPSTSDGGQSSTSSVSYRPAAEAGAGAGTSTGRSTSPELQRTQTNSSSSNSTSQQQRNEAQKTTADSRSQHRPSSHSGNPYRYHLGRRYLRDTEHAYPLPVDIPEVHRQSLRLVLFMQLFGGPFCNSVFDESSPPVKVLELACGSALWSAACHDFFRKHGHSNISFTGLDIAPLAPDLKATGMDWTFVQHDLRYPPIPLPDAEFDFIFIKDTGFTVSHAGQGAKPMRETMRMLKPGGVVELWESDHVFRTLLPNPAPPPTASEEDIEHANECAAYAMGPQTAFAQTQNRFLSEYNVWVEAALGKKALIASPCAIVTWMLGAQDSWLEDIGSRRLAVPFSHVVRWEGAEGASGKGKGKMREKGGRALSEQQASLRTTALEISVRFIEAMEPLLRKESGKRADEWEKWKSGMMRDLLVEGGASGGECLELGAWWATKVKEDKG